MWSSNVLGALAAIFTALAALFGLLALGKSYFERKSEHEKAADAERRLLELQERIQDRHLPDRDKFVSFLKESEQGLLEIRYSGDDPESGRFAREIESAFKEAGWNDVFINKDVLLIMPKPEGLYFHVKSADSIPPWAGAIQEAFKVINIPMRKAEKHPDQDANTLVLVVGSKP